MGSRDERDTTAPRDATTTRRALLGAAGLALAACAGTTEESIPSGSGAGSGGGGGVGGSGSGGSGSGGGGGEGGAPEQPPTLVPEDIPPSGAFGVGVWSGDPTPEAAVVAGRYDADPGTNDLVLMLWRMENGAYAAQLVPIDAPPGDGGYLRVDVEGLMAASEYRYAFVEIDGGGTATGRSAIGAFRTAPAVGSTETIVFAAIACTFNTLPQDVMARAAEEVGLAAVLLLGDSTYNDGASSLADYRDRWGTQMSGSGYTPMRASHAVVATWDDHEVGNNYNPETVDPEQMASARQAFFEFQPVRRALEAPDRLWRSLRWGDTVELFVLDCRSERKPSTRNTPAAEYVSVEQMTWLKAQLSASTAAFKIIMNSVPIGDFPDALDLLDDKDRWTAYASQRTEILEHIDSQGIAGVVWLSGDFHIGCTGRVSEDGPGADQLEVLAGPGAQFLNPLHYLLQQPQYDWATDENNYTLLRCDPRSGELTVTFVNGDGDEIHTEVFAF